MKDLRKFKRITNVIIVLALLAGGYAMSRMIVIERGVNDTNRRVLEEAKVQERIMDEMIPQFKPSEDALEKNRAMMPIIEDLNATVTQINDMLRLTNRLVAESVDMMRLDNEAMARLNRSVAASVGPLAWMNDLTALSVALANTSASILGQMNTDMATQNVHAASVADKMEGSY